MSYGGSMERLGNSPVSKNSYAELHLHLGGAITPRMLWHTHQAENGVLTAASKFKIVPINGHLKDGTPITFKTYEQFQRFFYKNKKNLNDYLEMHHVVEPLQRKNKLAYYASRMMRAAFEFENLSYIEIRHTPWGRTDKTKSFEERVQEMREIVTILHDTFKEQKLNYPITVKQILCLHSQYTPEINQAIFDLCKEMSKEGKVCGLDIAGGETKYSPVFIKQMIKYFEEAHEIEGLFTTAHIFETRNTPEAMFDLLPFLNRIGHGIMIPLRYKKRLSELAERGICLEICPTTYIQCSTFKNYYDKGFREIFKACDDEGVDIVIGTDNGGMHGVRLQAEFENLLIHEVISHKQFHQYRLNAFKHAFTPRFNR